MDPAINATKTPVPVTANGPKSDADSQDDHLSSWGFQLEPLYKLCMRFYKEKEGKAVHLTYKDKVRLVALTKQVSVGPCGADVSVGFLDVVGNDRRQAWQALGNMTRVQAMTEFVRFLDSLCPLLRPYVEAHKTEKEELERKQREEELAQLQREAEDREHQVMEMEAARHQDEENHKRAQQEMQIRAALNQQTAVQFRQYAEQQFPGDAEKQDHLILQLQEQHFQQYMQQVYQQQLQYQQHIYHHQQQQQQQQQNQQYRHKMASSVSAGDTSAVSQDMSAPSTELSELSLSDRDGDESSVGGGGGGGGVGGGSEQVNGRHDSSEETEEDADSDNDLPPIAAASMWTRKDMKEFKESLKKDKDAVIKVGSGETVTVRVPTHEDGTCLFWEFATDNYDIGFGVYFEWTIAPTNAVSVHVSESSDEDEEPEQEGGEAKAGDIEKGSKQDNKPPTDEIIPIYRRDCHEEVYCGSHMYPGQGVYLLKFDNSYSLWRSKTLYYRVYYTR